MAARHKYRLPCQTINKQNKLPCKASGIYCKSTKTVRCRIHGGASEGPKTEEGRIKALRNLKQYKNSSFLLTRVVINVILHCYSNWLRRTEELLHKVFKSRQY